MYNALSQVFLNMFSVFKQYVLCSSYYRAACFGCGAAFCFWFGVSPLDSGWIWGSTTILCLATEHNDPQHRFVSRAHRSSGQRSGREKVGHRYRGSACRGLLQAQPSAVGETVGGAGRGEDARRVRRGDGRLRRPVCVQLVCV